MSSSIGDNNPSQRKKPPTCIIFLGMAGSGKTTLVKRMASHLLANKNTPYIINLDPAVLEVPYPANIDICDTVKYKEVMKQYNLGPNGAIITSLNLFTTRFDQVINILEKQTECEYILIDTPGQIEVFTWSASGSIIMESLAVSFPTIVVYVLDTVRSHSPVTFMSNMLYACSILYKCKLPFIVALNKTDVISASFINRWMTDFEVFHEALEQDQSYISNLSRSASLVLDTFYEDLETVSVSAKEGTGMVDFLNAVGKATDLYNSEYLVEYQRMVQQRELQEKVMQEKELQKFAEDRRKDSTCNLEDSKNTFFRGSEIVIGGMEEIEDDDLEAEETNDEEKHLSESFQRYVNCSVTGRENGTEKVKDI